MEDTSCSIFIFLRFLNCGLVLATDIYCAWPYSPFRSSRHFGEDLECFWHELQTGLAELLDPPTIDDRVEHGFEVTQPQHTGTGDVERWAVVEISAKHRHQAKHRVRKPAQREADEKDEDSREGPGLEAHVDVHLVRLLQPGEA